MSKNSHFFGQPVFGQLIKSLDKSKILGLSRNHGGEKYVKSFDGYTHLLNMLFAVIMRFDSLCEIEKAMTAEVRSFIMSAWRQFRSVASCRMPMQGVSKSYLSMFTGIYMSVTKVNLLRTAEKMAVRIG